MKTLPTFILLATLTTGFWLRAADAPGTAPDTTNAPAATNVLAVASPPGLAPAPADTNAPPATLASTNTPAGAPPDSGGTNAPESGVTSDGKIYFNMRNAPLDLVLNYMSDAAGFVINLQTEVKGRVDMWSKGPVTKDEMVDLLNSALNRNGYAAIRNGRILTIVSRDAAKTQDVPVKSNRKLEDIPKNDEIVTEIIPVRHATASQLTKDLEPLLPTSATMTANESANSLVITDTQADIHRVVEIVNALDGSISSVSTIKVFPLQYADATALASVIKEIFATQSTANAAGNNPRAQFFNMFRGPGGFPGAQANTGSNGGANTRVVAVADDRSNSLVVSAPQDMMSTIADMVKEIDQPVSDITELRVFHLKNADPTELANQFTQIFPSSTQSSQNQFQRFRFGGPPMFANNQNNSSERQQKQSQVVAVADPRTSSLIVSAASTLMPQIAQMIAQLDESPAKKEKVLVYDLQNADPQDVQQVLQDLFNRNNTMRTSTANRNSLLQNNPLTTRATQNQQGTTTTTTTGFGNMGARTGTGF
jgi:general secretion pathway protein D